MKKLLALLLCGCLSVSALTGCGNSSSKENVVYVYNWGEYLDPETLELFEQETGIKVTYDQFETNEEMYPIIEAGAVNYDVVCPSDYMIQKMVETLQLYSRHC